jgi:hypothetical protein
MNANGQELKNRLYRELGKIQGERRKIVQRIAVIEHLERELNLLLNPKPNYWEKNPEKSLPPE